jgi:hypothetical protein
LWRYLKDGRLYRPISAALTLDPDWSSADRRRLFVAPRLPEIKAQTRRATGIDVNERLRNRGKAISNEKKKDALRSMTSAVSQYWPVNLGDPEVIEPSDCLRRGASRRSDIY